MDTNVLITHGPPYGILDSTIRTQESVGCKYLRDKLYDIHGLNVHVFGHMSSGDSIPCHFSVFTTYP